LQESNLKRRGKKGISAIIATVSEIYLSDWAPAHLGCPGKWPLN